MKFEVFSGTTGRWHWHAVSSKGQILAIGAAAYADRDSVVEAIQLMRAHAATAEIWEISSAGVRRVA